MEEGKLRVKTDQSIVQIGMDERKPSPRCRNV